MRRIPAVKLLKQRIDLSLRRSAKLLQKQCLAGTRHFQFFLRFFLFFNIPHRNLREEFSDFVNQIRRILRLAGRARFRKGKVQPLRRFCQISVEMEFLLIHRLPRRRGQLRIRPFQLLAVIFRENAAARVVARNQPVIHADEKQHADVLQTRPFIITDQYLVRRRRNNTDRCLRKSRFQNFLILCQRHLLLTQHLDDLVQQLHDDAINLTVFFCKCLLALLFKLLPPLLEFFLHLILYRQRVQGLRPLPHRGIFFLHPLRKRLHFSIELLPQKIALRHFIRLDAAVAPRPGFPIRFQPADTKREHIVFHRIRLLAVQTRKTAAQIAEDALVRKTLYHHLDRRTQKFHERIHQHGMLFVHEIRNTTFFKDFPRIRAVNRKISGQNGEILVTHALLAHHAADQTHRLFQLGTRIRRDADVDALLFRLVSCCRISCLCFRS